MAVTAAEAKAMETGEPPAKPAGGKRKTLLDDDVSMPGYCAPGDGPFDTVDPAEHASSVVPDKAAAAAKGFGAVNAVVPIPDPSTSGMPKAGADVEERTETYEVPGPDGKPVRVTHNLETGETSTG